MAKDKPEITVFINAEPDPSKKSGYRFWMVRDNAPISVLEFDKVSRNLKKSQYFIITFKLDPTNHAGLRFSRSVDTVFWAKAATSISDHVDTPSQFPGVLVDPATPITDTQLVVINIDRKQELFAFAFNFLRPGDSDGPATNYALYDPIGSNRNNGVSLSMAKEILVALTGLVIGAIVGTFVIAPALL